ncbi:MAG: DUF4345 family protein [Candidatus Cybelea sp.]
MTFSRGLLWLNIFIFAIYGLAYLVAPESLAWLATGFALPSAATAIDLRATYSGFAIGVTAFLWMLLRGGSVEMQRIGQLGCVFTYGGIAFARLVGIVATGKPTLFMWVLLCSEVLGVALSLYALRGIPAEAIALQ